MGTADHLCSAQAQANIVTGTGWWGCCVRLPALAPVSVPVHDHTANLLQIHSTAWAALVSCVVNDRLQTPYKMTFMSH